MGMRDGMENLERERKGVMGLAMELTDCFNMGDICKSSSVFLYCGNSKWRRRLMCSLIDDMS
jgi:hypothetical protein